VLGRDALKLSPGILKADAHMAELRGSDHVRLEKQHKPDISALPQGVETLRLQSDFGN
jgi:hypothetical protein